jgi:exonuclease SbcC
MITVHERGIAQTKDRIASINGEISRLNAERLPLMQDFTRIDAIVRELKGLLEQWERAKADVDRLTAEKAASEAAQRRYQDLNAQVGLVTGRLDVAAREYDLYAVLSELFHRDGIPTLILENGLGAIEKKANDVLERMPGSFALEIITQKANKTNSILKETLDVVVLVDGQERAYELLSGGERFRVDFALRIGLASVLGHRAGSSIRTLWLDEPLAALDANGREAVVESLSAVSDDFELVVVVSHHDEFSDRLPARINVTKTDGISTARIAA